ncbi:hypothetical protein [Anoxybacteroides tepidamans]|uniref:hypothetical protein n=1 Tax=Anoxybacteroides tepidamans TaxID=265948 RepID=UPI00047FBDC5|nr:hypothetical protein [Anoxybacillus tepidamans]
MSDKVKSSGVMLNNTTGSITVHVQLLNLDDDAARNVTVRVLDWGTGAPPSSRTNPVATLLNFSGTIPENTRQSLSATVPAGTYYEVRVNLPDEDLSVNIYAATTTAAGAGWLEGHTVRNNEFFKIDSD